MIAFNFIDWLVVAFVAAVLVCSLPVAFGAIRTLTFSFRQHEAAVEEVLRLQAMDNQSVERRLVPLGLLSKSEELDRLVLRRLESLYREYGGGQEDKSSSGPDLSA